MFSINLSQMSVWVKRVPMKSVFEKIMIPVTVFFTRTFLWIISLNSNSNPLVSIIIAAYGLILLYLPSLFFELVLSPVLICTGVLLVGLLRLGVIQRELKGTFPTEISAEQSKEEGDCKFLDEKDESENGFELVNEELGLGNEVEINNGRKVSFSDVFVEWNRGGPLEVIYEEYEGQEEEVEDEGKKRDLGFADLFPLALYYPDSDSGSSSGDDFPASEEWDRPENICFRWGEERNVIEGDNMIEISLPLLLESKAGMTMFPAEEDNLIEIDLSDQKIVKGPRIPESISFTFMD